MEMIVVEIPFQAVPNLFSLRLIVPQISSCKQIRINEAEVAGQNQYLLVFSNQSIQNASVRPEGYQTVSLGRARLFNSLFDKVFINLISYVTEYCSMHYPGDFAEVSHNTSINGSMFLFPI